MFTAQLLSSFTASAVEHYRNILYCFFGYVAVLVNEPTESCWTVKSWKLCFELGFFGNPISFPCPLPQAAAVSINLGRHYFLISAATTEPSPAPAPAPPVGVPKYPGSNRAQPTLVSSSPAAGSVPKQAWQVEVDNKSHRRTPSSISDVVAASREPTVSEVAKLQAENNLLKRKLEVTNALSTVT